MTKHTKITADQRAQIFELLREDAPVETETVQPKYLDDVTAEALRQRAVLSFSAPPCARDIDEVARPKFQIRDINAVFAKPKSPNAA